MLSVGTAVGVMWYAAGCGEPVVFPKPDVSGTSGGETYQIEVQFELDATRLVTSVTAKGGTRELSSAVLSAARGMRFDCTAEARGRLTHEIKPGRR